MPPETARIAHAAFPNGNPYLLVRDTLGPIYSNPAFAALSPTTGQPAAAPAQLALVTIMQFVEDLSDRQAADAVRSRIDWKYMLALELDDPGFDASVLSEFRTRLLDRGAERLLFDTLLARCRELGVLKARGRQRTDSTHVLAAARALNRLELVVETMRHVLNSVAIVAPEWLRVHSHSDWVKRYERRPEHDRLPTTTEQQHALAELIGNDGQHLLTGIYCGDAPTALRTLAPVELLRRVWLQTYHATADGLRWRSNDDIPPAARFISSPHDPAAHLGRKGSTCWVGYKVPFTELCDDDVPALITHVETTAAPIADGAVVPTIHQALSEQALLPVTHIADTGYVDAELLVTSRQDFGVDLLGPTRPNPRWQTRAADGFGVEHFAIAWAQRRATCPRGHVSTEWHERLDNRGNDSIYVRFSTSKCGPCPDRPRCVPWPTTRPRRSLSLRPQAHHAALQAARAREQTKDYVAAYARRAGIEGTISRGVRRCGLRRSRYIGAEKVHLEHLLIATAINLLRVSEWLADQPRSKARRSAFTTLMKPLTPA